MRKDLEHKLNSFFSRYKEHYDDDMVRFTMDNIEGYLEGGTEIDLLSQVAYAIGEKSKHPMITYDRFIDYLKEHNGLDQDFLEVSCGMYPVLADKIDQYQTSIGKGSITGMDPLLITTSLGNIRLNREIFNINTDISKYSLVTGFYPCDPTLDIITKANKEDKDFTLALCGCTHYSNPYQFYLNPSYDGWLNYLYNCALETVPSDRKIEFDDVEGFEYPIIFSKKKRM